MKKLLLAIVLLAVLSGCVKTVTDDGQEKYSFDPNVAAKVETGVQTGIGVMTILSAIFPVLLPIVGIGGGVLGTWLKVKPTLVKAQAKSTLYYNTTASIVAAIEDFKGNNPDKWAEVEKYLTKTVGLGAENVIRALRNLPIKE